MDVRIGIRAVRFRAARVASSIDDNAAELLALDCLIQASSPFQTERRIEVVRPSEPVVERGIGTVSDSAEAAFHSSREEPATDRNICRQLGYPRRSPLVAVRNCRNTR